VRRRREKEREMGRADLPPRAALLRATEHLMPPCRAPLRGPLPPHRMEAHRATATGDTEGDGEEREKEPLREKER
jgi:hypothetical protein